MKLLIGMAFLFGTAAAAQTPSPTSAPGFGATGESLGQRPCLSADEARGLATFVLPGLIDGLAKRCRGALLADGYLRQPAASTLSTRLRMDAAPSWPIARAAIEKLNGSRLPTLFGDRFVRNAAEGIAADLVLRDFDPTDCGAVDRLVSNLAPLPSANMSNAVAALIALGGDRVGDSAPLRICPAVATPAPAER